MKRNAFVPFTQVRIGDGFWKNRQQINENTTLQSIYRRFVDTGRFAGLDFDGQSSPHIFYDSDIAKWFEACAYVLSFKRDEALESIVDDAVDKMIAHQRADGYYNMYFLQKDQEKIFTGRTNHELYCAGHLIEAAIAYKRATGKGRFLDMMLRVVDCIEKAFLIDRTASFTTPGHEEIELALVKLYDETKDEKYLRMARFFVDKRGEGEEDEYAHANHRYSQSHLPVREQRTAEGHAVRAVYLYCAMADLALLDGDRALKEACEAIFRNITDKRMYITGGIGSSERGEAFTIDYDLPNLLAYAESCAGIGLMMLAQRMFLLDADSLYTDAQERVLYNAFLSAVSLDGKAFFYLNPLEIAPQLLHCDASAADGYQRKMPITQRREVFGCSCCPPNIARMMASLGSYLYAESDDTFYIHHFVAGEAQSGDLMIKQTTRYPADGVVHIEIRGNQGKKIAVRKPGWCQEYTVKVDGKAFTDAPVKGYLYLPAQRDMTIDLEFAMTPVRMEANPAVYEDCGKVAVQYGPIVYCAEAVDNGENIRDLSIGDVSDAEIVFEPAYGCNVLYVDGFRRVPGGALYRVSGSERNKTRVRLIPYFAFANRGESEMAVWLLKN